MAPAASPDCSFDLGAIVNRFPRGSEWRKWDLHIHPPRTKLSNSYADRDGQPDWAKFCQVIEESDVYAVGITDYFSLDGFYEFKEHFEALYPDSEKAFFPNLELRLNEVVNEAGEPVDIHLILRPDLSRAKAQELLQALKTENTGEGGRKVACADLSTQADYERATVSRAAIKAALESVFGSGAVETDHLLIVTAANNSGIRADGGSQRKRGLADEIDKDSHAFFGNPANVDYFLRQDRLEGTDKVPAKPVFAGCDAHRFEDLEAWLGREATASNAKHVTWVKADLTFEGLQQTLVEPAERVRIQATMPDKKEPYKVISRITFSNTDDFPAEVVFSPGLTSIIGSRSSGKSALLAYVAHAVDPQYTVGQQMAIGMKEREAGPGASITWDDVKEIGYKVEWASPTATTGRVIYIPQNSLFAISERPDDITAKIRPAVFRADPDFEADFKKTEADVQELNESIEDAVEQWFRLATAATDLEEETQALGDRAAVEDRTGELARQIDRLQKSSALASDELAKYQDVMSRIAASEARIEAIADEARLLSPYVQLDPDTAEYAASEQVAVEVHIKPAVADLPEGLAAAVRTALEEADEALLQKVGGLLAAYRAQLATEHSNLLEANDRLRSENAELIKKSAAHTQIAELVKELNGQKATLETIDKLTQKAKANADKRRELETTVSTDICSREDRLDGIRSDFNASGHQLDGMLFSLEVEFDPEDVEYLSAGFNKLETSDFIVDHERIDVSKAQLQPGDFIQRMKSGEQKVRKGEDALKLTKAALSLTRDVRFVASLEGDHIGGFTTSTMTQGKQALFALTLILAESHEPWPLLIDQPEDDLDSRSVCDVIIKDLMWRKRERQVIMVSHNANLVIGADSEEVIVANRHGDDRPNRNNKKFAYLTGSLEYSKPKNPSERLVLESAGIREHACEILDGGAEAFQKRKDKYRI
jgi:ABC-type cobalamin/Fe3+-siderophores transport system ATPase subunit